MGDSMKVRRYAKALDLIRMLDSGANVNSTDDIGRTQLWWAAGDGDENVVRLLINREADTNIADEDGRTPLHTAVINSHLGTVKLLLENGADVNKPDNGGFSPMYWAKQRHSIY